MNYELRHSVDKVSGALLTLVKSSSSVVSVVGGGRGGGRSGPAMALSHSHSRHSELSGPRRPNIVFKVIIVGGLLVLLLLLLATGLAISSSLQNAAHLLQVISKY